MPSKIHTFSRLLLAVVALTWFQACDLSKNKIPTDQKATPVEPELIVIELTTDRTIMSTGSNDIFAQLRFVAYDARTWEPLPDGTDVRFETNLGNLESMSGPQAVTIELFDGEIRTQFHAGDEGGFARIQATVLGVTDQVEIEIIDTGGDEEEEPPVVE